MDQLKQYAQEHKVPVMQDEGLDFLLEQIQSNHCLSFLELGTAIARTSIEVAKLDSRMKVVTIERNPEMIVQAKKNIEASGLFKQIQLIEGDALEVEVDGHFDCIFIDAAKAQYKRFFEKYSPLLNDNGIIISDNMNFHGLVEHPERTHNRNTKQLVRKLHDYHDFLASLTQYETKFYDYGDGVACTRRK